MTCFDGTNTEGYFIAGSCTLTHFATLSEVCRCPSFKLSDLSRFAEFDNEADNKDEELSKSVENWSK